MHPCIFIENTVKEDHHIIINDHQDTATVLFLTFLKLCFDAQTQTNTKTNEQCPAEDDNVQQPKLKHKFGLKFMIFPFCLLLFAHLLRVISFRLWGDKKKTDLKFHGKQRRKNYDVQQFYHRIENDNFIAFFSLLYSFVPHICCCCSLAVRSTKNDYAEDAQEPQCLGLSIINIKMYRKCGQWLTIILPDSLLTHEECGLEMAQSPQIEQMNEHKWMNSNLIIITISNFLWTRCWFVMPDKAQFEHQIYLLLDLIWLGEN